MTTRVMETMVATTEALVPATTVTTATLVDFLAILNYGGKFKFMKDSLEIYEVSRINSETQFNGFLNT